jgi:hypothetical protein
MAADKFSSVDRSTAEEATVAAQLQAANAEARRERSLIGQLAEILKFADLMAIMMVLATAFSAIATWRTASITNMLVSIAERPYIGVQRVAFDTVENDGSGRLLIDCRNFGHVSGSDGVVRIRLVVDGKTISPRAAGPSGTTVNVGMFAPSVPQVFFRFVPASTYQAVRDGTSLMIAHIAINYRGPDEREFCYSQLMTYDHRADAFSASGGSDRCDSAIY